MRRCDLLLVFVHRQQAQVVERPSQHEGLVQPPKHRERLRENQACLTEIVRGPGDGALEPFGLGDTQLIADRLPEAHRLLDERLRSRQIRHRSGEPAQGKGQVVRRLCGRARIGLRTPNRQTRLVVIDGVLEITAPPRQAPGRF